MSDEQINYADFGDDEPAAVEPKGRAPKNTEPADEFEGLADEADEGDEPDGENDDSAEDELADLEDGEGDGPSPDEEIDLGDDIKLTRKELKELAEKREDYSRYADELRVVEAERETFKKINEAVTENVNQLYAHQQAVLGLARSMIPPEPDKTVLASDPAAYVAQLEYRQRAIEAYNQIYAQAEKALNDGQTKINETHKANREERVRTEVNKLLKAVPQLAKPKKFDGYLKSIEDYGSKYGYQPAEIREAVATDHRMALILRKAALYDAKVAARPIPDGAKAQVSIPAATRTAPSSKKAQDRKSLSAALDRATSKNVSRVQSLQDIGRYFNDD